MSEEERDGLRMGEDAVCDTCFACLTGEERENDARFAWLMGADRDMPFYDWVEGVQSDGTAERSYIFYTDRMATLYALPKDKRAAALDAIVEEMLVRRHRPLPPELEAVIAPMAAQMRRDSFKYRRKCERKLERYWK